MLRLNAARAAFSLLVSGSALLATTAPVAAATPAFQLPFACGEVWIGTTYQGHGHEDSAVDFSFAAGASGGRRVLNSAAGTVTDTTHWRENGELTITHAGGWRTVYAHLDGSRPAPSGFVPAGAVLGIVDATPNPIFVHPDGFAHLHYEQQLHGVAQHARMNGATFATGIAWRSLNCPPPAPPPPPPAVTDGPAVLYGAPAAATVYRWGGPRLATLRGQGSTGAFDVERVGDRVVAGDFNGNGTDDVLAVYDTGGGATFFVWEGGAGGPVARFTAPDLDLETVGSRVVAGDWNDDGLDDVALAVDLGESRMLIRRYQARGISGGYTFVEVQGVARTAFDVGRVANRVAAGHFDNVVGEDIVMGYQTLDGHLAIHVFSAGRSDRGVGPDDARGTWYTTPEPYDLGQVAGRMVAGRMAGSGHADVAFGRATADGRIVTERFETAPTGGVAALSSVASGTMPAPQVGNRMAAGDITGDGADDVVYAFAAGDGTLDFVAWASGAGPGFTAWNGTGGFDLGRVDGRLVIGDWE